MSNRIYNTKTATHTNALMSSVTAFICPRLQLHPEAVGGTAAAHNKAAEKIREVRGGSIWTLKTSRRGHTHTLPEEQKLLFPHLYITDFLQLPASCLRPRQSSRRSAAGFFVLLLHRVRSLYQPVHTNFKASTKGHTHTHTMKGEEPRPLALTSCFYGNQRESSKSPASHTFLHC